MSIRGKRAVVAGHICLDIFPGLEHLPPDGLQKLFQGAHLLHVGAPVIATGGPVPNTGIALHRLGIPTRLMTKVGADLFGKAVRELVAELEPGLMEGVQVDPEVSTAYTFVFSAPGMDRMFMGHAGASDTYTAADIDYDAVGQADLFHFGYPTVMKQMYAQEGAELLEVFRRAKLAGQPGKVLTSLDTTFPDASAQGGQADWRVILSRVLPYVDIFLPSFEELFYMLHKGEYEERLRPVPDGGMEACITPELLQALSGELLEMGVKLAAVKLGSQGLYLRTAPKQALEPLRGSLDPAAWGSREMWSPCFQVQVKGTTGAGDATIAGFLSALLRGLPPAEAMTMAVAVGACCVEAVDALSGICTWEETERRVRAGWEKHTLSLDAPGWVWERDPGNWVRRG